MTGHLPVAGNCPMGCGETLQRQAAVGTLICTAAACPRPDAVAHILREREIEHIVQFDADGFTIRHPLRERLDDALMQCELHRHCARRWGPPDDGAGRFRAIRRGPGNWVFQRVGGES
ncbi:DUF6085 family protein [Streptomyces sp. NPDC091281]|uniref:DUF6085 family protein n=1 Tax=Streptomyces sp. NPDC091281 TaxID=3365985 RepID=UPI0038228382